MTRVEKRTIGTPHDRYTRLADAMLQTLEAQPEYQGERGVAFVEDSVEGGMATQGYENELFAALALLEQIEAIFLARGWTIEINLVEPPS